MTQLILLETQEAYQVYHVELTCFPDPLMLAQGDRCVMKLDWWLQTKVPEQHFTWTVFLQTGIFSWAVQIVPIFPGAAIYRIHIKQPPNDVPQGVIQHLVQGDPAFYNLHDVEVTREQVTCQYQPTVEVHKTGLGSIQMVLQFGTVTWCHFLFNPLGLCMVTHQQ